MAAAALAAALVAAAWVALKCNFASDPAEEAAEPVASNRQRNIHEAAAAVLEIFAFAAVETAAVAEASSLRETEDL